MAQKHDNMGSYQTAILFEGLTWQCEIYSLHKLIIKNHTRSQPIQEFAMEILLLINR